MFYILKAIQPDGSDKLLEVVEARSIKAALSLYAREQGTKVEDLDQDILIKRCADLPEGDQLACINNIRALIDLRPISSGRKHLKDRREART